MEYKNEFREMLEKAEKEGQYVGTGNPNAKILIIGKELAINQENEEQITDEIKTNVTKWKENIANSLSQNDPLEWTNPLYLYKHSEQKKEGHTWNKYQKLIDYIREVPHKRETDFQEYAFLTEYNANPSKTTAGQDNGPRKQSIKERNQFFKDTKFFQQFPIVIVAAGDYANKGFGVSLEETFQVKWEGVVYEVKGKETITLPVNDYSEKPLYWYSLHTNTSQDKLVVHTHQLSGAIPNRLLQEIAREIKKFWLSSDKLLLADV